jgi:hypothetical protein
MCLHRLRSSGENRDAAQTRCKSSLLWSTPISLPALGRTKARTGVRLAPVLQEHRGVRMRCQSGGPDSHGSENFPIRKYPFGWPVHSTPNAFRQHARRRQLDERHPGQQDRHFPTMPLDGSAPGATVSQSNANRKGRHFFGARNWARGATLLLQRPRAVLVFLCEASLG